MPYWRFFYHIVWSTKDRQPWIDEVAAPVIERSLRSTCEAAGVLIHALGMMPDHVHLAVSIPPTVEFSKFVGRLKGASSHAVNAATGGADHERFSWQSEYGGLTFGEKALPDVVAYVNNQATHHARDRLWTPLEVSQE